MRGMRDSQGPICNGRRQDVETEKICIATMNPLNGTISLTAKHRKVEIGVR